MKNKKRLILTSLVCLLPLLVGAALYSRLPETVPMHWNLQGEVDGWGSRAQAVFLMPGFLLGMNLVLAWVLDADPKRANMSPALRAVAQWSVPLLSLLLSGVTLSAALGHPLPVERVVPVFVGLLFILIGNYLPKSKQSYTMGIRLPWTLASEENWNRTHRLAGYLWILGGLAFVVMSFIGWTLPVFFAILIVITLVPVVYSYLLYRKGI